MLEVGDPLDQVSSLLFREVFFDDERGQILR
jgi:hypothetical protein